MRSVRFSGGFSDGFETCAGGPSGAVRFSGSFSDTSTFADRLTLRRVWSKPKPFAVDNKKAQALESLSLLVNAGLTRSKAPWGRPVIALDLDQERRLRAASALRFLFTEGFS